MSERRSHPICWTGSYYLHDECRQPRGTTCIEDGCDNEAGTIWGPYWCPPCDVERLDRISAGLDRLAGGLS